MIRCVGLISFNHNAHPQRHRTLAALLFANVSASFPQALISFQHSIHPTCLAVRVPLVSFHPEWCHRFTDSACVLCGGCSVLRSVGLLTVCSGEHHSAHAPDPCTSYIQVHPRSLHAPVRCTPTLPRSLYALHPSTSQIDVRPRSLHIPDPYTPHIPVRPTSKYVPDRYIQVRPRYIYFMLFL